MRRLGESGFAGIRQGYAKAAEKLAQHAATGLKWCPQIAALNQAMLLGMGSALPREKREAFANSGTVHVFAISGLHVMMIAALVNSLLSCLGVPVRARCAIAVPVLAAYVMLTGTRPSAVRAALMAAAWMSAGLFGCKADWLSAWSAAAILVYGSSPAAIFDSGCTLSFTVMLGLLLWIKWSAQFSPPSAMLFRSPAVMAPGRAWLVRLRRAIDWLSGMLGVSLAAWIAGAPVVATLFGKISPVGIPANIIMVPLAGVSVVLNAAGTGASLVSPVLGAFFNNLAAFSTMAMDAVSRFAGGIPAGSWDTLPWKWHHFAMWYSAWVACFALLSKKLRPKAPADGYEWSLRP
jgi:competence protein ComEC